VLSGVYKHNFTFVHPSLNDVKKRKINQMSFFY